MTDQPTPARTPPVLLTNGQGREYQPNHDRRILELLDERDALSTALAEAREEIRHGAEALETLEKVKEWLREDIALAEHAGFGGSDRVAILLEVLEQMAPTREGR